MSWTNVKLIYCRELRDQMRDRRTLFTIFVLPLLLYPILAMLAFQMQQFRKEYPSKILVVGAEGLPPQPLLFEDGHFALSVCPEKECLLLEMELSEAVAQGATDDEVAATATAELRAGKWDAVVHFPREFSRRLAAAQATDSDVTKNPLPQPEIFLSTASDKSQVAHTRVTAVIGRWRDAIIAGNLKQNNLPVTAIAPFNLANTDVAEPVQARAALWAKVLPFVLLVWALTGAFYPAVDLCAGEKERGTLETLLSSPAQRSEIVWGKLLTVMTFSMATSLLNLASMGATGTFIAGQLEKMAANPLPMHIGPPPLAAIFWLVLALVPISAMFSALSLAVAAFARSSKEGQYYLLPLLMISLPLMMLSLLPNSQLDVGTAMIPLTGVMLLLRVLIEGQLFEALKYLPIVAGVTSLSCWFAIRWAIHQFNDESVLFRESERFHLGLWVRQMLVKREDAPTVGEAVCCGVTLLVIRFFSSFMLPPPRGPIDFINTTLVVQIALIATPACLMAIMLTRRPLGSLGLRAPSHWATLPAAVILAACLHPAAVWLSYGIEAVYPKSQALREALATLGSAMEGTPAWQLVLLLALLPAVCEELAFRGFVLNGLRRSGHKWGAILVTSALFGVVHMLLQQSLSAFLIGIVIGYVAVKTNSIWPAMLFHFTHNSLAVLSGFATPEVVQGNPILSWLLIPAADIYGLLPFLRQMFAGVIKDDQLVYNPLAVSLALVAAAGILYWHKRLPYHFLAEERLQEALNQQGAIPAGTL
ncbi:MAG: CPBP family intramembrane metalloprotease [Pirellulaceae bacterium]|nr:CPBP family intramembrane metalloprotease [Pirellulaceae bacterium]